MPQVPAKRYDLFIKAFEKKVEEAQKQIAAMDRLMRPYEICRAALELAELENETSLDLRSDGILIRIVPLDHDREEFYHPILQKIGSELLRANLHKDGIPTSSSSSYDFYHIWRLNCPTTESRPPTITLRIDVPLEGTSYIEILKSEPRVQTYTEVERKPIWLKEPKRNKPTDLGGSDDVPF